MAQPTNSGNQDGNNTNPEPVPERRGIVGDTPNPPNSAETDRASTSYADALKSKTAHHSPWLQNNGNFDDDNVTILRADRILPKPAVVNVVDDFLCLDETDYTPIEIGWGFCLLGFFAGRFPSKEDVRTMAMRWPHKAKISHHRNGWVVFRFKTEAEMRHTLGLRTQKAAGSSLILCPMPKDFRFDTTPEVKYQVWVTLPNLPLGLWTPSALGKIASMLGEPVEVDVGTLTRHNIEGPRCLILFNALKQPVKSVNIRMHNGDSFTQHVRYDYFPLLCSKCMKIGHTADRCRVAVSTAMRGSSNPPRSAPGATDETGWQEVQRRKKGKQPMVAPPSGQTRHARSRSRKAGPNAVVGAAAAQRVPAGPEKPRNTHKRFATPPSEPARTAAETDQGEEGIKSSSPGQVLAHIPPQAPEKTATGCGATPSSSDSHSTLGAANGPHPLARRRSGARDMIVEMARKSAQRGRSVNRSTKPCEPRSSSAGNTPRLKQVPLSVHDTVPLANKLGLAGNKQTKPTKGKGKQTAKRTGDTKGVGPPSKPIRGDPTGNTHVKDPTGDRIMVTKQKGGIQPTKHPVDQ